MRTRGKRWDEALQGEGGSPRRPGVGGSSPRAQLPGGTGSSLSRLRQAASCRRQALA